MATAGDFHVVESVRSGAVVLRPEGELDLATVPTLRDRLEQLRFKRAAVVLELSGLTFLDSSGLALLVRTQQAATRSFWDFSIDDELAPEVRRALDISGIGDLLPFNE